MTSESVTAENVSPVGDIPNKIIREELTVLPLLKKEMDLSPNKKTHRNS